MSRMIVIGVRHDKLKDVEKLSLDDVRLSETDYVKPILENNGVLISGHHYSHDSDNVIVNKDGVRYLNSADASSFKEQTKEALTGPVDGAKGLDIAYNLIFRGKDFGHTELSSNNVESPKMTLFSFNTDNTSGLKRSLFKDMVQFIRANPEHDTLMQGNYLVESGFEFGSSSPVKFLGTLNENTMGMVNLDRGVYGVIALPAKELDLTSETFENEVAKALGIQEKPKRKMKMR